MDNTNDDERYMRMALREAEKAFDEKEIPIGCVIVKDGVVIGKGHNQIEMLRPTPKSCPSGLPRAALKTGVWTVVLCM